MPSPIPAGRLDEAVFNNIGVAYRLQPRDTRVFMAAFEQVSEAALQFQIVPHRNLAADLAHLGHFSMLGLKNRIKTALDRKLRQSNRIM